MSGHIPPGIQYLPVSTGIDVVPSALHMCSFLGLQPNHFTYGIHPSSVDALVDIHGIRHNFPFFPPQGSFTGRSLGDHLTAFLLWHPLFITSDRGSLAWGGAGTPAPFMMAAHTQGMPISDAIRKSQFWWRICDHQCWFVTS